MQLQGRGRVGVAWVGAAALLAFAVPASADAATISIDDPSVTEGGVGTSSDAVFNVSLSEPSTEEVTVDFGTSDGTALGLLDYAPHSETVTFAPGDTSKQVAVQAIGDLIDEPDETFAGDLSNASANASVADAQGTATIVDDDGAPGVSIDDATVTEGDSGKKDLTLALSLSNPSVQPVTVDYATANATATTGDNDYDSGSGTVTFAAGDTSETVTVKVNGDTTDESDETFNVDLSNPTNASITDTQGVGTIEDDDPSPAISIGDVSAPEGSNSGQKNFDFPVSLANPSDQAVTVDYATADGTATTGDGDYDSGSGTVTFSPGDTSETVAVKVNGDNRDESDETFNVNLSGNSSNSSIADGQGTGTIQNDDPNPGISIGNVSAAEGNSGQKDFDLTISLSNPSDQAVTVDYATANATATTGDNDYDSGSGTVTFAAGDTSETVTVKVNGDEGDEGDETFNVNLSNNSSNSSIADGQGTGTIQNDDGDPAISIDDVTSTEGDSGEKDFDFASFADQSVGPDRLRQLRHRRRHRHGG